MNIVGMVRRAVRIALLSAVATAFTESPAHAVQEWEYSNPVLDAQGRRCFPESGECEALDPCANGGSWADRCGSSARAAIAEAFCRRAGHTGRSQVGFASRLGRIAQPRAILRVGSGFGQGATFEPGIGIHFVSRVVCLGGSPNGNAAPAPRRLDLATAPEPDVSNAGPDTRWGRHVVPFLSSRAAHCARGGHAVGLFAGRTSPVVGTPLVARIGLLCRDDDGEEYSEEHGDRNASAPLVRCPSGHRLTGAQGRAGLAIDRINRIRCTNARSEHRWLDVGVGGSGGEVQTALCDRRGTFLRVRIFKNIAIDILEWSCQSSP